MRKSDYNRLSNIAGLILENVVDIGEITTNLDKMSVDELAIARQNVIESIPWLSSAHEANDEKQLTDDADIPAWLQSRKALDDAEMLVSDLEDLINYKTQLTQLRKAISNITSKY